MSTHSPTLASLPPNALASQSPPRPAPARSRLLELEQLAEPPRLGKPLENERRVAGCELLQGVAPRSDRDRPRADRAAAGDVPRRVADDDDARVGDAVEPRLGQLQASSGDRLAGLEADAERAASPESIGLVGSAEFRASPCRRVAGQEQACDQRTIRRVRREPRALRARHDPRRRYNATGKLAFVGPFTTSSTSSNRRLAVGLEGEHGDLGVGQPGGRELLQIALLAADLEERRLEREDSRPRGRQQRAVHVPEEHRARARVGHRARVSRRC